MVSFIIMVGVLIIECTVDTMSCDYMDWIVFRGLVSTGVIETILELGGMLVIFKRKP